MSENEKDFGIISPVDVSSWGIQDNLIKPDGDGMTQEEFKRRVLGVFENALKLFNGEEE